MQLIPKVGVSEEIAGDLLELENKIESFENEINVKIEEVYDLHDDILNKNKKFSVSSVNNSLRLQHIGYISSESSIIRNRLVQLKLNTIRDLRKYEVTYKKFFDKIILVVDGKNAETRQAKVSEYLITLYEYINKMKTLIENIDIAINDLASLHSSLKLQFFVIKTDLGLSIEGIEEITA